MPTDLQYLQTQLNELQVTLSAHNILTQNAIDAAGENKRALAKAHVRLDELHTAVQDIKLRQVTKTDIEDVMSVSFNKRLIAGLKGIFVTGVGIAFTAAVAWAFEHLTFK